MSYAQLSAALAEEDDAYDEATTDGAPVKDYAGEPPLVQHRYFKSSRSLHTAISFAAGTVMLLFGYEQASDNQ